ncbi:MAG: LysR family transcriptional regulator [Devosiaceae bacterium]
MSEPNWSDFRVIFALKREGSVAGAARMLGVDGSTVSRRLAAAEEAFGATLIVRGGGDFTFTSEGLAIAAAAETMNATVNSTRMNVRSMRDEPTGTVKIACVPTAAHVLRPLVSEVAAAHPGLQVDLLSSTAGADLAKGDADIAVRTIAPKDPGLVVAYTFTWGRCLYASTTYLERHGRPNTAEDLHDHQLVRIAGPTLHAKAWGWLDQFDNPARPAIKVENSDSARLMIEQDAGIGSLFCAVGDTCTTLERALPDPFDQMDSWVLYHESTRGSHRVRVVLDALVAFLRGKNQLLTGLA